MKTSVTRVGSCPAVTVLIPAYNAGTLLQEAVASILAQTFTDFECLVIDDGSTDGSVQALEAIGDPRLRIVRNHQNIGLIATLNRGLQLARAPLLARMDADDVCLPDRLQNQVNAFSADPELAVVGTWARYIDERGTAGPISRSPTTHESIVAGMLQRSPFIHPTVMFRLDAIRAVGGYPTDATHAEDYALWLNTVLRYRCANLPEVHLLYRVHSGQVSQQKISKMWAQACRLRSIARDRFIEMGLPVPPPSEAGNATWNRLHGRTGTLGADYATWAWCYRSLGQRRNACLTALAGLKIAPLSGRLWSALIPYMLQPSFWWQRLSKRSNTG